MPEEILSNEEIDEILSQYEGETTEEDEELLLWIALAIGFDATIFTTRLEREIAILRAGGTGDREIASILQRDFDANGRIFGELRNSIRRGIVLGIMQSSRLGQNSIYGDSVELFKWVNVSGHRICEDCLGRAGEIDSWDGWVSRGMPGSGWSLCQSYCYCILVPASIDGLPLPIPDTVKVDTQ